MDDTIDSLIVSHSERAKDDPNVQYLMKFIEDDRENRGRKSVSLNLDTRKEERTANMARALELENGRRAAVGLEALESLEDIDEDDRPDIQLDQAAGIVRDLAEMREIGEPPAQAAQVSP
jgi:carboxyl-terminal processing protease